MAHPRQDLPCRPRWDGPYTWAYPLVLGVPNVIRMACMTTGPGSRLEDLITLHARALRQPPQHGPQVWALVRVFPQIRQAMAYTDTRAATQEGKVCRCPQANQSLPAILDGTNQHRWNQNGKCPSATLSE